MTKINLAATINTYIFLLLTLLINPAAHASKAPVFELPGNSGSVSLKKYKNQVVVVDFWASWCVPCKYSFPWLNEMQERYGEDGLPIATFPVAQWQNGKPELVFPAEAKTAEAKF